MNKIPFSEINKVGDAEAALNTLGHVVLEQCAKNVSSVVFEIVNEASKDLGITLKESSAK